LKKLIEKRLLDEGPIENAMYKSEILKIKRLKYKLRRLKRSLAIVEEELLYYRKQFFFIL